MTASAIQEISLERRCFGCAREGKLTFRMDGTAARVTFGQRRMGTVDVHFTGLVARADFDALARLLLRQGVLDLQGDYPAPESADGETIVVTVTTATEQKQVRNKNQAGPENLARIQGAIEELGRRVTWTRRP